MKVLVQRALLPLLALLASHLVVNVKGHRSFDPYQVLGLAPECSNDEIRRAYRAKCLSTHPDKTVKLPESKRKHLEEAFKLVQKAYDEIGDPDKRRSYDLQRRSSTYSSWQQHPRSTTAKDKDGPVFHKFYRFTAENPLDGAYTPVFRFSAFDFMPGFHHHPYHRGGFHRWGPPGFVQQHGLQSIFVQVVPVSLEDLYTGAILKAKLETGLLNRIIAAFRGGIGVLLAYQSLLYALPLVPFSRVLAFVWGLYVFSQTLPNIQAKHERGYDDSNCYSLRIQPGYKGGTTLTFTEKNAQVVFVLHEREHAVYERVGNDLHTTVTLSARQARTGCAVEIPALNSQHPNISVSIPAGLFVPSKIGGGSAPSEMASSSSNTMIVVPGKGWPYRRRGHAGGDGGQNQLRNGDLIVHVKIVQSGLRKTGNNNR